jgi:hypothetical protein
LALKYVQLRDKVAEIMKRHKEELSKFVTTLDLLEGWMLDELNRSGSESIRTTGGTFFKTIKTSVTCPEWSKTLAWIQDNDAWELLEARVSKTATEAILQDLKAKADEAKARGETVTPESLVIPGVAISREVGLNVRRA